MLTNPYYVGCVRFDGVLYEDGRHPVFISRETFNQVQAVLRARKTAGDKPQQHFHHLKGSLFCGACGSRMGITNATGRWGGVYPYFYCLGRQRDTHSCTQPYVLVELVEREVERWWARISLTDTQRARIRGLVVAAARTIAVHGHAEATRQKKKITKLEEDRRKLLRLHLDDTIDEDLFKDEQDRLRRALDTAHRVLDTCQAQWKTLDDAVNRIMLLCEDSHTLYRTAPDIAKQQLNQAVFHRFYVLGRTLAGADLHSPLAQLLADDLETRLTLETRNLIEDIQDPADAAESDQQDDDPGDPREQPPSLTGCLPRQRPYGPLPIEKDQPRMIIVNRGSNMATLVEVRGLEPLASSVRGRRSTRLSYTPWSSCSLQQTGRVWWTAPTPQLLLHRGLHREHLTHPRPGHQQGRGGISGRVRLDHQPGEELCRDRGP